MHITIFWDKKGNHEIDIILDFPIQQIFGETQMIFCCRSKLFLIYLIVML